MTGVQTCALPIFTDVVAVPPATEDEVLALAAAAEQGSEHPLGAAIVARATDHGGSFHGATGQVGVFGRQLRKRARDARDEVAGRVRRDGTGRDHGYPGGRARPPRFDPAAERREP